jgi:hypothetical protein
MNPKRQDIEKLTFDPECEEKVEETEYRLHIVKGCTNRADQQTRQGCTRIQHIQEI